MINEYLIEQKGAENIAGLEHLEIQTNRNTR
jgi:hypothetical protein